MVKDTQELKIIWFDPGITSGYAEGFIKDGLMLVVSGQEVWNELEIYLKLISYKPDIVGYERFEVRRGKMATGGVELFPRNLIGVINLYCMQQGDRCSLYKQMPAQALGKGAFFNTQRLKADQLHKPGRDHANEALKHLLRWWTFGAGFQYNTKGYKGWAS